MRQNLPQHIAVIPDGNRRWAKSRGLALAMGHLEGRKRFREISQAAFDLGIPYFTFWAMSEDNHKKRSATEINFLVALLKKGLRSRTMDKLIRNQVRFRVLGNWDILMPDQDLANLIRRLEDKTRGFDKHHLTILLGYDGEKESIKAIQNNLNAWHLRSLAPPVGSDFLDSETIRKTLWTGELPPVDLEIRTGETQENWFHNSSGFMMWHTADSEIRLSQTLWPDFSVEEFKKIVAEYGQRERKFGQ